MDWLTHYIEALLFHFTLLVFFSFSATYIIFAGPCFYFFLILAFVVPTYLLVFTFTFIVKSLYLSTVCFFPFCPLLIFGCLVVSAIRYK